MKRETLEKDILAYLERGQNARACEALVKEMGREIRSYLYAITFRRHLIEDLYQDVLERMMRGLPGFKGASSIETWVLTIARNVAINADSRYSRHYVSAMATQDEDLLPATGRGISTIISQQELVARAAQGLKAEDREIIFLRVDKELPFQDIAQVLCLENAATARKRYERAKKRFEDLLGALAGG